MGFPHLLELEQGRPRRHGRRILIQQVGLRFGVEVRAGELKDVPERRIRRRDAAATLRGCREAADRRGEVFSDCPLIWPRCSSESAARCRWRGTQPIRCWAARYLKPSVVMNFSTLKGPIAIQAGAELWRAGLPCLSGGMETLMRSVWNSPVCFSRSFRIRPSDLRFGGDQFGHKQAGQNAVFLRHVTFDAQAAGFFAADNDGFAFHQCADVFETDRCFMNFDAEQVGDGIDLMAGGDGADDRAGPAAVFLQMIERQRQNLVGREPRAVLVDNAEAIGVAVEAKAELRFAAADEFADFGHAFGIGLGMMSAKERIEFIVKDGDLGAGVFEQRVEVAAAGAVHEFDGDFQSAPF